MRGFHRRGSWGEGARGRQPATPVKATRSGGAFMGGAVVCGRVRAKGGGFIGKGCARLSWARHQGSGQGQRQGAGGVRVRAGAGKRRGFHGQGVREAFMGRAVGARGAGWARARAGGAGEDNTKRGGFHGRGFQWLRRMRNSALVWLLEILDMSMSMASMEGMPFMARRRLWIFCISSPWYSSSSLRVPLLSKLRAG